MRRRERLQYQQRLASLHKSSGLSVAAPPFQPKAAVTIPGPAERPCDPWEAEKRGFRPSPSPSHHSTTPPVGDVPLPMRGPYPLTLEDDAASDAGPTRLLVEGREGAGGAEVARVEKAQIALTPPSPPLLTEVGRKRKMDSLIKSRYHNLVGRRATQVTSPMPSDSGLRASHTTGITMRTHI